MSPGNRCEVQTSLSNILEISQHSFSKLKAAGHNFSKEKCFLSLLESGLWPWYGNGRGINLDPGKEPPLIAKIIFPGTSQSRRQRQLRVPMTSLGPALHNRGKNWQGKLPVYIHTTGSQSRFSTFHFPFSTFPLSKIFPFSIPTDPNTENVRTLDKTVWRDFPGGSNG